ncbi:hypothetical protein [Enterococcus villorum]|uniref:hypothetical protein n=1 Tax=Enterococcus villorum TaxID=112904 RepID=UPI001F4D39EB|nr:hypothetical protein [Enterococcus villorum]
MKTRKKLLNSTLILALAFGQTSGTVVEAVSVLNAIGGSINTKKVTKEKEETKSKTTSSTTEVAKNTTKTSQQSNTAENKEVQVKQAGDQITLLTSKEQIREITQDMLDNQNNMTLTKYSYEVGDKVDFFKGLLLNYIDVRIAPLSASVSQYIKVDEEYISESGNWKLRVKGSGTGAVNAAVYFDFYFTRLKISSLEKEVFNINTIWFGPRNR